MSYPRSVFQSLGALPILEELAMLEFVPEDLISQAVNVKRVMGVFNSYDEFVARCIGS